MTTDTMEPFGSIYEAEWWFRETLGVDLKFTSVLFWSRMGILRATVDDKRFWRLVDAVF